MVDSPWTWKEGTLIQNPDGIFDTTYWEKLGLPSPPNDTSGVIVLTTTTESSVPSFIFTILTPSGRYRGVSYEALTVSSVSR